MNILPKKSWHVRNKDNIQRVRRDEEKAAEEEKERQRKIALAEQEARTELLRQRSRKSDQRELSNEESQIVPHQPAQHVKFFSDLEEGKKVDGSNKEYEDEKRAEKEKYERSIGLLTYLGQSASEAQHDKPWYYKPPTKKVKVEETADSSCSKSEVDRKKKSYLDPMHKMTEYLHRKKHKDHKKEKDKHRHKHKYKHKDKKVSKSSPSTSSSSKTIQQLRAERLKREQEERQKTQELLAKMHGGEKVQKEPEVIMDDRKRGYNSQFNPDLARKPKNRDQYY